MVTPSITEFGELLRRHRLAAGLTQEALAEKAGISTRGVSDLERGVIHAPRRETLALLLEVFALTADERQTLAAAARRLPRADGGRTRERRPFVLPSQPAPIVGRDREMAEARRMLRRTDIRLLTFTGPGGVGKTRLALRVAADLSPDFSAGVCLVSLAPVTDSALVASAIAAALGVREARGRPLAESIATSLRDRQLILLLDNFEQITAAAPLVADLLAACAKLKVITTSRTPLHLRGEQEFPVEPLAVPEADRMPTLATVGQSPAATLFVQRARAVRPNFTLSDANAAAVAEICRRLDGLPLAIELAAAWIKLLSPAELLQRLSARLPLLIGGPSDLPPRLRTMRDAIAWSYALLMPEEQTLLRRLAVFSGGFTLDAAEQVTGDGSPDALKRIASLVDKSLVRRISETAGASQFAMLETIREFALDRLQEAGQGEETRRRHAVWFCLLAERAEPELTGPDQDVWLTRLAAEHDNLRTALAWTLAVAEPELGLRLAGALSRFWQNHGHLAEGRGWLEQLLAIGGDAAPGVRAKALGGIVTLALRQGDFAGAEPATDESLALYRSLGDKTGTAWALNFVGVIAEYRADYPRACAAYEECLALRRQLGDQRGIAVVLGNLGIVANDEGDFVTGQALTEEALALRRELGDRWGIANGLHNLGIAALGLDDVERADRLLDESRERYQQIGETWGVAGVLGWLGRVAESQGDLGRAVALQQESLAIRREIGDQLGIARSLEGLARVAAGRESWRRAALLCSVAERIRSAIGAPLPKGECMAYDRAVVATRAALGDVAFAGTWHAAAGLTIEQAIAAAVGGRSDISAEGLDRDDGNPIER